jgi:hypothetical protein
MTSPKGDHSLSNPNKIEQHNVTDRGNYRNLLPEQLYNTNINHQQQSYEYDTTRRNMQTIRSFIADKGGAFGFVQPSDSHICQQLSSKINNDNSSQQDLPQSTRKRLPVFEKIVSSAYTGSKEVSQETSIQLEAKDTTSPKNIQSTQEEVQKLRRELSSCLSQLNDQPPLLKRGQLENQLRKYNDQLIRIYENHRKWSKNHCSDVEEGKEYLEANNHLFQEISSIASYSLKAYNPYSERDLIYLEDCSAKTSKSVKRAKDSAKRLKRDINTIDNDTSIDHIKEIYIHFSKRLDQMHTNIETIDSKLLNDKEHLLFQAIIFHNRSSIMNYIQYIENNINKLENVYNLKDCEEWQNTNIKGKSTIDKIDLKEGHDEEISKYIEDAKERTKSLQSILQRIEELLDNISNRNNPNLSRKKLTQLRKWDPEKYKNYSETNIQNINKELQLVKESVKANLEYIQFELDTWTDK